MRYIIAAREASGAGCSLHCGDVDAEVGCGSGVRVVRGADGWTRRLWFRVQGT